MNYQQEFKVAPEEVLYEIWQMRMEKVKYDDYGKPVYNQTLTRKDVVD